MGARLLLLFPALTVAVLGVLLLWIGEPRAIESASVWGGPTDALARWTSVVRVGTEDAPSSGGRVRLIAQANSVTIQREFELDSQGMADVELDFGAAPPGSFELTLYRGDALLARGKIELASSAWRARAQRRGGYFDATTRGTPGHVQLAPGRGVLAVPFSSPLWVRVRGISAPELEGARVELQAEGASFEPKTIALGAAGTAQSSLTPREHAVAIRGRVVLKEGAALEFDRVLPVLPGALYAERRGEQLRVASPVQRDEAFVTIVSEQGRHLGRRLRLRAEPGGTASAVLALPAHLPARCWAMVETIRHGPARERVGWPLFDVSAEPAMTFEAPDVLLLDGFGRARLLERARLARVRRAALIVAVFGALLSAAVVFTRARRQAERLNTHLDAQLDAESRSLVKSGQRFELYVAIFLILLGFATVWGVVSWRLP